MASSYPGALDALTNPTATDTMDSVTVPHATQHANVNDAIEAIQGELGTDPAGASATVKARLDTLDTTVGGKAATAHSHAQADVTSLVTDLGLKAPAASPTFTGTVTTPLTTAGYVKTSAGGVLSSSAAVAEADVTGLTSALAGKVASVDLPYSAVVPGLVQFHATSAGSGQQYGAAQIYNAAAFTATSIDRYMEWTFFVAAGTYTLRTCWRSNTSYGIASISIDGGAALGTTIDMYAATAASNNITDITGIALTAGRHTIRFTGATKNASSSAYTLYLHGFSVTRTGA